MKLIFMGSPAFAVPTLEALLQAGHEILAVYTQPPRPAHRGHKVQPSPIHAVAEKQGLTVLTPTTLKDVEVQQQFAAFQADATIVVAYGLLLPQPILDAPRFGCLNYHPSKLPRWRGAAPMQWTLLAGDTETAGCIMQMDEGWDSGAILLSRTVPLSQTITYTELEQQMRELGGELMVEVLAKLEQGAITPTPQDHTQATYAPKIDKTLGRMDWTQAASALERKVRALNPWPGSWFEHQGERIRILKAAVQSSKHAMPGTVIRDGDHLAIQCEDDALTLHILQREGRQPQEANAFLRGYPLQAGEQLPA